jgi:hypothetical protein
MNLRLKYIAIAIALGLCQGCQADSKSMEEVILFGLSFENAIGTAPGLEGKEKLQGVIWKSKSAEEWECQKTKFIEEKLYDFSFVFETGDVKRSLDFVGGAKNYWFKSMSTYSDAAIRNKSKIDSLTVVLPEKWKTFWIDNNEKMNIFSDMQDMVELHLASYCTKKCEEKKKIIMLELGKWATVSYLYWPSEELLVTFEPVVNCQENGKRSFKGTTIYGAGVYEDNFTSAGKKRKRDKEWLKRKSLVEKYGAEHEIMLAIPRLTLM